ncbi:MAG: HIT family hydrolase [Deltaproteobacteria bacterium RIFCSPLOWO2_02_FULL_50_16]|nr:MAG: HIT family hydrolase [Deltaproteobacteria bacterium RIFCSPHIGHO2_02_FULL_50_15]OGQ58495.1 MAG: HIT family hydrolase [Deltaproteobacteria bacterium RIFCSPLOWO2_02_FULL_50_16]OGQ67980.1 MAG: HIT family hydrolase [Deltaproteobacteria bacterium RIFCSPLOWO2_12_FULL_50_11]
MKTLWAPWRMDFILKPREKGCIFCKRARRKRDREDLILFRGRHSFVILNRFPYSNCHLMVVPYKHTPALDRLDSATYVEIMRLMSKATRVIRRAFKAQGFNLGSNIGHSAGAGIADHVHFHVVPRWVGDHNFMPIVGETKVMPDHLENIYDQIKKAWRKYS